MLSCYTCPNCQEMNRWLKKIIDISDVLEQLGIAPGIPIMGWVFSEKWARDSSHRLQRKLTAKVSFSSVRNWWWGMILFSRDQAILFQSCRIVTKQTLMVSPRFPPPALLCHRCRCQ